MNIPRRFVNIRILYHLCGIAAGYWRSGHLLYCQLIVSGRRKKEKQGQIFTSIRKPTAPSSQKFGPEKRDDKLDPVRRKAKHKKKKEPDADIQ